MAGSQVALGRQCWYHIWHTIFVADVLLAQQGEGDWISVFFSLFRRCAVLGTGRCATSEDTGVVRWGSTDLTSLVLWSHPRSRCARPSLKEREGGEADLEPRGAAVACCWRLFLLAGGSCFWLLLVCIMVDEIALIELIGGIEAVFRLGSVSLAGYPAAGCRC
jgi:hypothetical protein